MSSKCCEGDDAFNLTVCTHGGKLPNNVETCRPLCVSEHATKQYMGPIHPRDKKPVGVRLAQGAAVTAYGVVGPVAGPTLSGCTVAPDKSAVTVRFNSKLLAGGAVEVQKYVSAPCARLHAVTTPATYCMASFGACGSDPRGHVAQTRALAPLLVHHCADAPASCSCACLASGPVHMHCAAGCALVTRVVRACHSCWLVVPAWRPGTTRARLTLRRASWRVARP